MEAIPADSDVDVAFAVEVLEYRKAVSAAALFCLHHSSDAVADMLAVSFSSIGS